MINRVNGEHVVKVNNTYWKPFWFDNFMYFVDICEGNMYSGRPIYLQDRDYASLSDLRNYFQDNEIEVLDAKSLIK